MDLSTSSEQEALLRATADWCAANLPLDAARRRPPGLWAEMEAMGWTAMTGPEMGLDHATEALVFAELGRHLAPVGLLSTAVAARWSAEPHRTALAITDPAGATTRLFDVAGAGRALGLLSGRLVQGPVPAGCVAAPGLDPSAPMVRLDGPQPAFAPLGDRRAALHLQLLAAAFAVGCAEAARDMAAGYAKVREQFGRPIGWFQALKHMCADMAVRAAMARSQLCQAAAALDAGDSDSPFHAAAAMRLAEQAAIGNAAANIQVHGGIGMTDEASPHLCLKRAHLLSFVAPASREMLLGDDPSTGIHERREP